MVTAEDGTWGLGLTVHSPPVLPIINDHFASLLAGENCMATEKLWDVMVRSTAPFGGQGLASYAISAVDTALWDLKGKLLQKPVYELLGGPQKDKIFCYASGFEQEWYMELGFKATKLFTPWGAADGLDGLKKIEELVATTRQLIGDDIELCLDCWLSQDVEHLVRLAEMLRPYRLKWMKWIEDYGSLARRRLGFGYAQVRQRLPWQHPRLGRALVLAALLCPSARRPLRRYPATRRAVGRGLRPNNGWGQNLPAALFAEAARRRLGHHPRRHELREALSCLSRNWKSKGRNQACFVWKIQSIPPAAP